MGAWNAFEVDRAFVLENFRKGFFDYVEVASHVAETRFFRWLLGEGLLERLAKDYPTPRKKEEVPLWVYLSSELTLKLHGASGFAALPYVLHCGGLKDALGPEQVVQVHRGDSYKLFCRGFNKKNVYDRVTPCDQDFVRKLARSTPPEALQMWLGFSLSQIYSSLRAYDPEGIFLVDGTYLFVPDNDNYEDSALLAFDQSNHPISMEAYQKLSPAQKRRCKLRRCYRAVTLLHTNRAKSFYLYCGLRVFNGARNELPYLKPIVEEYLQQAGKRRIRWLVFDRGFIDGRQIGNLKKNFGIDSLFPLRRNMDIYRDAEALAKLQKPDVIWKPPAPKEPEHQGKPQVIRKREETRRRTLQAEKKRKKSGEVLLKEVHLRVVPQLTTWDACPVPLQALVITEHFSDGSTSQFILATTAQCDDAARLWELYQIRPTIEERHRQLKCFWDLTNFRSTKFSLVVNQIVFVLLAYSLMQLFLLKSESGAFTASTRRRLLEQLLPQGKKVFLYYRNRVASLDILEYQEILLSLKEGARRRILGKTRRLRKNLLR